MASRRARTRQHRRDRRLAKASNWARAPKPRGDHVGHGTTGTGIVPHGKVDLRNRSRVNQQQPSPPITLKVELGILLATKK
jgi:hypothetical protein